MLNSLTARQRAVYDFLRAYFAKNQRPPTIREIGDHLGIRHPNGVVSHLRVLEQKNIIARDAQTCRGIRVLI